MRRCAHCPLRTSSIARADGHLLIRLRRPSCHEQEGATTANHDRLPPAIFRQQHQADYDRDSICESTESLSPAAIKAVAGVPFAMPCPPAGLLRVIVRKRAVCSESRAPVVALHRARHRALAWPAAGPPPALCLPGSPVSRASEPPASATVLGGRASCPGATRADGGDRRAAPDPPLHA